MGRPRLVIVTRTFWPLVGAAATTAARLAIGLMEADWGVTILTARYHESWPARIHFHDAMVRRLGPPHASRWAEWRFQWALKRWLHRHAEDYDLVYVLDLHQDARTVLRAVGRRCPVVLRAPDALPADDSLQSNRRKEQAAVLARLNPAAVVCGDPAAEQALAAAGFSEACIQRIPNGVRLAAPRTAKSRLEARNLFAEAGNVLRMPEWAPLAVYLGAMQNDRGLEYLVAAWPPVGLRWPNARLWLVGDGPFRDGLRRQISGLKLSGRAMVLGRFDHVEELLDAADVLVHPGACQAPSLAVAEAMGAGLPVIAADSPGHRALLEHNRTGLLVPPANIEALTEALIHVFDDPNTADRLGRAAHDYARRRLALAKMVGKHVILFQSLLQQSASR